MPDVTRSIDIKARPSEVWRWLSSQEALRRWISPNLEIELSVGGAYRFLGPDGKTWVSGRVLEYVPEGRLALSWMEEGSDWIHPARLVVTIAASPAGALVTLVHDGFAGIGKPGWADTVQDYERGADAHQILEKLAALVNEDVVA
ncbi:MAG: SRPBCC domain-containing protein [Caulobacteraceae bacterium]|jgi:uncharacterized protein YndB with AHSA1/START domain